MYNDFIIHIGVLDYLEEHLEHIGVRYNKEHEGKQCAESSIKHCRTDIRYSLAGALWKYVICI